TRSPLVALGVCQALLALTIAGCAYAISFSLPFWPINPENAANALHNNESAWHMFHVHLAACIVSILPPAVLWGASFPLALAAATRPGQDPGRLVGRVYAANTLGAIAGAALFSLVLVPDPISPDGATRLLIVFTGISALIVFLSPVFSARRDVQGDDRSHVIGPIIKATI